jgi:ribosome-binding protein aMBF1 (putative translation factor)
LKYLSYAVNVLCPKFFRVSADSARNAICSRVASILRAERIKKGLSMTALSKGAGLSQQGVSYIERGTRLSVQPIDI